MSNEILAASDAKFMVGNIHACPLRGHWTSFQLVDEFGSGKPYAGLTYEITDYEDVVYTGKLDASGVARVDHHYFGPVVLKLTELFQGAEAPYKDLRSRANYPIPVTELQVRAEKTRFFSQESGARTLVNPAKELADPEAYYQVEVSELVKHVAHLPPLALRNFPPNMAVHALFCQPPITRTLSARNTISPDGDTSSVLGQKAMAEVELGFSPPQPPHTLKGIALMPNKHHVLEVRPMRALRPVLSTNDDFCALNLYQLALMSTLSYTDFGQEPNTQPVKTGSVSFPLRPSSGYWFGHALPQSEELWKVKADQTKQYYPLYEEVPYSKRLEIVPFDPLLYPEVNDPALGDEQEHPAKLHFLDDRKQVESTDTQAFITHHEEVILVCVRGTSELLADASLDGDAYQVPFEEGEGKVHRGFYEAAKMAYSFVTDYMEKFYSGQKLLITGHSLGGAVALLLSEMLRRNTRFAPDIVLYTYGAPRASDTTFIESAELLIHHRIVNHNDPVPSVPATWMNTLSHPKPMLLAHGTVIAMNPAAGLGLLIVGITNFWGDAYGHHGKLRHFMPVDFGEGHRSSILWEPGCSTVNDHGCAKALKQVNGLPNRGSWVRQLFEVSDHFMVSSYIPGCWASLRRWKEAHEQKRSLVTPHELKRVSDALAKIEKQLNEILRDIERIPSAYERHKERSHRTAVVRNEIKKIEETQTRLMSLQAHIVTEADVYGSYAERHELVLESLIRWNAHAENTTSEQLAISPPVPIDHETAIAAITGGHAVGAPFHLDIDSIV
ncbi:lipase family protein [Pseudomonas sp. TMB3-21]